MRTEGASPAVAAAAGVAASLGLRVDDVVVLQSANRLALRLLPCDVFAHAAPLGREVAAREVELARRLADSGCAVARLEPRVAPRVYERDGFAITFWTHYETTVPDHVAEPAYAAALHRLHVGMRAAEVTVEVAVPHFTDRVAQAARVVADHDRSPALTQDDRALLLHALRDTCAAIEAGGPVEQLLHGEPHPGNLLATVGGPVFVDLETSCRGPVELDVAHAPDGVGAHYPGLDQVLLAHCRRLARAVVGAWRWDADDDLPDGRRQGREIVSLLRGPPGGLRADS